MLLTEVILSKRGPLAKVWLSAHQEKKLSKQQALGVDIGESVDAIREQEDGAITLRLSGQLMLGVARIYSRKVQYLLDDCKETRERITLAFRPGIVDLPEDQLRASKAAITFPDTTDSFNYLDWTWTAPPPAVLASTSALPRLPQTAEFGAYNFGRPRAPSLFGTSASSHREGSSHLDSHEFSAGDMSVEQGRRDSHRLSMDRPLGSQWSDGREKSLSALGGDLAGEMSFEGPVDLGLDFDLGGDLPELASDERIRRESSALSTPPPVSPAEQAITDLTPRTAQRVARLAQPAASKPKRPRLLQADDELEMPDLPLPASAFTEPYYVPAEPAVLALREMLRNPAEHFLPTRQVDGRDMIFVGPHGLAPELEELFAFPVNVLRRHRDDDDDRASKRPRKEGEGEEVEQARRDSQRPLSELGDPFALGGGGDQTFDLGLGLGDVSMDQGDPFQLDLGGGGVSTPRKRTAQRDPSLAPSRAESIARQVQYAEAGEGAHPLAMFDSALAAAGEGSSATQETPTKSSVVSGEVSRTGSGYSRHTGMAMGLLRREIEAIEEEDKVVQFDRLAEKATKKAASAFFFELLVLGTRDCVKLDQPAPYAGIGIRAKDKLFEGMAVAAAA